MQAFSFTRENVSSNHMPSMKQELIIDTYTQRIELNSNLVPAGMVSHVLSTVLYDNYFFLGSGEVLI